MGWLSFSMKLGHQPWFPTNLEIGMLFPFLFYFLIASYLNSALYDWLRAPLSLKSWVQAIAL